jgi:hypothetical protein
VTTGDDDQLLARLRAVAAELDSVPADVLAAARTAIDVYDLDGELAELVADSGSDLPELAFDTVRSGAVDDRLLAFEGAGVRIDVEIFLEDAVLTVAGQLTGAAPGGCVLERDGRAAEPVDVDALGRFLLVGVPVGPVRFRCHAADGRVVRTVWISL